MWKKWLPPFFAVLLIAPTALLLYPKRTDAILGCLGGYLFNSLIGGAQALGEAAINVFKVPTYDSTVASYNRKTDSNTKGSLLKECILDITAKQIARTILQSFTKSVVNWINSGFEGKPSFITNPEGFLMDVADKEFGREIEKIAPMLCAPFRLNLQFALGLQYSLNTREDVRCRLSDVIANVRGSYDSFVTGNFRSGGWRNWISITGNPQNNVYGAYLGTVSKLDASIVTASGKEIKLLDFGQGFKSWRSCEEYYPDEKDRNGKVTRTGACKTPGKIKTPGAMIVGQGNSTLSSTLRELEVADELDEIFGALVNQLLVRTLGPGGLLGNSEPEQGGGPSYLDQLVASPEAAERLATIRPPAGINCDFEYQAEGGGSNRVMLVSYRRANAEVIRIITDSTATNPVQTLSVKLLDGAQAGRTYTVENRGQRLTVSPKPVPFDLFENSGATYEGVETIRFPTAAVRQSTAGGQQSYRKVTTGDPYVYNTSVPTYRKTNGTEIEHSAPPGPDETLVRAEGQEFITKSDDTEWSTYFQQVQVGCRNRVNQYAEQNNDDALTRAGAPNAPSNTGTTPPPTQAIEGNMSVGKLASQSSDCTKFWNYWAQKPFAEVAVDGNTSGGDGNYLSFSCTNAGSSESSEWWEVDLEASGANKTRGWTTDEIKEVVIYRPAGPWDSDKNGEFNNTLRNGSFVVSVLNDARQVVYSVPVRAQTSSNSAPLYTYRSPRYTIPLPTGTKGRYVRIEQSALATDRYFFPLIIVEVEVFGKQTPVGSAGSTVPQNIPLQVGFNPTSLSVRNCPSGICRDFIAGETLALPPELAIQLRTNKELKNITLQAKLLVGSPPTIPAQWRQYFDTFANGTKSFVFAFGNSITSGETPPFLLGTGGDRKINPIVCADAPPNRKLKGSCLGDIQETSKPIIFAEGLTATPDKPVAIGFKDALLATGGFEKGRTVRILIEALYKDDSGADKTLAFPLDFVIN